MKPTPGPWRIAEDEMAGCRTIITDADIDLSGGRSREVCSTPGLADDEEDEANARLLAGAHAMFLALQAIADDPDTNAEAAVLAKNTLAHIKNAGEK